MKNYWLNRKPKILKLNNPGHLISHGKYYISGREGYLHKDGIWRGSAINWDTYQWSGYYDTFEEAESVLNEELLAR
jgi:hypothetical protein